jgi:hypothetical protein
VPHEISRLAGIITMPNNALTNSQIDSSFSSHLEKIHGLQIHPLVTRTS